MGYRFAIWNGWSWSRTVQKSFVSHWPDYSSCAPTIDQICLEARKTLSPNWCLSMPFTERAYVHRQSDCPSIWPAIYQYILPLPAFEQRFILVFQQFDIVSSGRRYFSRLPTSHVGKIGNAHKEYLYCCRWQAFHFTTSAGFLHQPMHFERITNQQSGGRMVVINVSNRRTFTVLSKFTSITVPSAPSMNTVFSASGWNWKGQSPTFSIDINDIMAESWMRRQIPMMLSSWLNWRSSKRPQQAPNPVNGLPRVCWSGG